MFCPLTHEVWKQVPGRCGFYKASTMGRLASFNPFWKKPRLLRPTVGSGGYLQVTIKDDLGRKQEGVSVHSLILETFVGPCPPGHTVCHGRGGPHDNRLVNLRWGDWEQQLLDKIAAGTHLRVMCVETGRIFTTQTEAAKAVGRSTTSIWNALRGRSKTCAGYTWSYVDKGGVPCQAQAA